MGVPVRGRSVRIRERMRITWVLAGLMVLVGGASGASGQEETPLPDAADALQLPLGEVIASSLLAPLQPESWRPLSLGSLFSEGWNEPYAPAPGDAPRQTWINNADGAFYRLFVFSFGYTRGLQGGGNIYNGSYFLFTPLSRRFEIGWFLPFVVSAPDSLGRAPGSYATQFGDLTIAPRVLLAESEHYTLSTNLFVRTPTGTYHTGNGMTSLSPDIEFWANPMGRWVVRGGIGMTVPTNNTPLASRSLGPFPWTGFNASPGSFSSFDARLAVGQYLTSSDVPIFKNLVCYLASNFHTETSGGDRTYFSLTPGFRFGLGDEWYVLGGLEVPVVGPQPFVTQTIFQMIKNF